MQIPRGVAGGDEVKVWEGGWPGGDATVTTAGCAIVVSRN